MNTTNTADLQTLFVKLLGVVSTAAQALESLAQSHAKLEQGFSLLLAQQNPSPALLRELSEFPTFDWEAINAEVVKEDNYGVSQVRWQGRVFTRRTGNARFGDAIYFSTPVGKDPATGTQRYDRLITFKEFGQAGEISRSLENKLAAQQPARQESRPKPEQRATAKPEQRATAKPAAPAGSQAGQQPAAEWACQPATRKIWQQKLNALQATGLDKEKAKKAVAELFGLETDQVDMRKLSDEDVLKAINAVEDFIVTELERLSLANQPEF